MLITQSLKARYRTNVLSMGTVVGAGILALAFMPVTHSAYGQSQNAVEAKVEEKRVGPKVSSFFLDNGLQVVVIPDHRAPVVTHMVWYKAGSADEKPGKSGIAHYLEHLMFKGTKTTKAGEFSEKVAAVGGSENAFTSTDFTAYFQKVTPEVLGEMMRYEADRMENLVLVQDKILAERDVVNEERNARTENNPASLLSEAMSAALYQNHRYGIPVIGWKHEVNALTKDDAIDFYNEFYTPNNAILVVAGDVNAQDVKKLAQATYGKVKRRAEPGIRVRPQEPQPRAARRVEMSDHRVRTPSFSRSYLVPSYGNAKGMDAFALDVLSEILGNGSTGRLYRDLVIEQKIASNVYIGYHGGNYDDGEFIFYATPRRGQSLEKVEEATNGLIKNLIEKGITEEELKRAKNRLVRNEIFEQDSQTALARNYGVSLTLGLSIEEVQNRSTRIGEVSIEDVNKAAKTYLQMPRSVSGYLYPQSHQHKQEQ